MDHDSSNNIIFNLAHFGRNIRRKMNTQIFKVGDRVFDALYGWGEVINCDGYGSFPVIVYFDKGNKSWYTLDGRVYLESNPTLSFTEYTLEGFSQQRSKPEIKFPCTGMFGEKGFGVCVGKNNLEHYICELGDAWSTFKPMSLEKYCKLNNIEL
jgi:hypothetical protein